MAGLTMGSAFFGVGSETDKNDSISVQDGAAIMDAMVKREEAEYFAKAREELARPTVAPAKPAAVAPKPKARPQLPSCLQAKTSSSSSSASSSATAKPPASGDEAEDSPAKRQKIAAPVASLVSYGDSDEEDEDEDDS